MMTFNLYILANNGRNTADVIIAQAGLERLAHATIVLSGKLSRPGFERLTAADQIELATTRPGVPVAVPSELTELAQWARVEHPTAAEAVTRLRNRVAHPPRTKSAPAQRERDARQRVDARDLSLSLLEVGLLATIGYEGQIRDRLARLLLRPLDRSREAVHWTA